MSLISPNNVTPESHIKVMRIKEVITNKKTLDSSCQHHRKCKEDSIEIMHINVRVLGVKFIQHSKEDMARLQLCLLKLCRKVYYAKDKY